GRLALVADAVPVAARQRVSGGTRAGQAAGAVNEPGAEVRGAPEAAGGAPETAGGAPEGGGDPSTAAPQAPTAGPADGGALWLSALEDEIRHAARTGVPLTLLLVDLDDADRLLAVETHGEASATFGRFAQAVRGVVRRP